MEPRAVAVMTLALVLGRGDGRGQSLDRALAQHLPKLTDPAARGLAQEMCYGVLRWHVRLDALVRSLLHSPPKDQDIYLLLLLGLYQLIYMRIAPHAAVNMTVAATTALKKTWAKGLVNAILRSYLRDSANLLGALDHTESTAWSHPRWLIEALKVDWPQHWSDIAAANNERPPLVLRVNKQKITRDAYLQQLAQAGIAASAVTHSACGVCVEKPVTVEALPGFAAGLVSVQDAAAQQAALLLDAQPGERVLDACAAPGGKACHILEAQPELGELLVLDCDAQRVARIRQNLERLQLRAKLVVGDATRPEQWWDGQLFDRILLDPPCSATGVIRRHPDIKCHRRAADIERQVQLQGSLLATLWPLLKSGGMLLYATCSVLTRENEQQMQDFLATQPAARAETISFPWQQRAQNNTIGRQILPGEEGMDGFYYAKLRKI